METIRVVLCGADAFRVEALLRGTAEVTHYAWNKRYNFSCASALGIDSVDKQVLMVSNVVVLCKGCRPCKDISCYENLPVISLADAPTVCVEQVVDSEFYYGSASPEALKEIALSAAIAPTHILYDRLLQCLTEKGRMAYERAFWLLDKDGDNCLNASEIVSWRQRVEREDFSTGDVDLFLGHPNKRYTKEQFIEHHLQLFAEEKFLDAWSTVSSLGTNSNGLPFSWYDVHSLRVSPNQNTYLSSHAIQFFKNIYRLKNFGESADIWSVTPGCAWENIEGFQCNKLSLDTFIEQWKYMAIERRDSVIIYARYWGYKGETSFLFSKKSCRLCRSPRDPVANTVNVLVVGADGCGKKSLVAAISTQRGGECPKAKCDVFVQTTTFFVQQSAQEEPQTIVYTVPNEKRAPLLLSDPNTAKTYDVVLLCYDSTQIRDSGMYVMDLYAKVANLEFNKGLPFVVVTTKVGCAIPSPVQAGDAVEQLESFCKSNLLLWPPVVADAQRVESSELNSLNEYIYTLAKDPELSVGLPPLSLVRLLRRATVVSIGVVVMVGIVGSVASMLRKLRR
ncbi:Ras like protein family, member T1 [Angomonas deanei]|nr:Ras like protein family, member T1 [Angomonas deanei]|eukprot:EPY39170.1 Ras like protein family, member T1 [Angomonas deanei]